MTLLFHSDTSYAQRSGFTATYSKHLIKGKEPHVFSLDLFLCCY